MKTVTIGIAAYNEENNIYNLLKQIAQQEVLDFEIKSIIVISDGSTDKTVEEAQRSKLPQLKVITSTQRRGKAIRLNEIFRQNTSDVIVLFDADIVLGSTHVIDRLVQPFLDGGVGLVCGWHRSLPPKTFVEKLAVFGAEVWEDAINSLGEKGEFYHCVGSVRAFSKKWFEGFKFPENVSISEDLYCFYEAKHRHAKVVIETNAFIYIRQPSTLRDYIKRTRRTIHAQNDVQGFAPKQETQKYQCLTEKEKLNALLAKARKSSAIILVSYILLQVFVRISSIFSKEKQVWDISSSTKQI